MTQTEEQNNKSYLPKLKIELKRSKQGRYLPSTSAKPCATSPGKSRYQDTFEISDSAHVTDTNEDEGDAAIHNLH